MDFEDTLFEIVKSVYSRVVKEKYGNENDGELLKKNFELAKYTNLEERHIFQMLIADSFYYLNKEIEETDPIKNSSHGVLKSKILDLVYNLILFYYYLNYVKEIYDFRLFKSVLPYPEEPFHPANRFFDDDGEPTERYWNELPDVDDDIDEIKSCDNYCSYDLFKKLLEKFEDEYSVSKGGNKKKLCKSDFLDEDDVPF